MFANVGFANVINAGLFMAMPLFCNVCYIYQR